MSHWISVREFRRATRGMAMYSFSEYRHALGAALLHDGEAWTRHHGEDNSVFYQRGQGFVNVLEFLAVLPADVPELRKRQVWWVKP